MQVHHGGGDLFMTQELLDGVQMRAGLQEVGGKGMPQRMHGSCGEVELFAGHNDQALEGGTGHGSGTGADNRPGWRSHAPWSGSMPGTGASTASGGRGDYGFGFC